MDFRRLGLLVVYVVCCIVSVFQPVFWSVVRRLFLLWLLCFHCFGVLLFTIGLFFLMFVCCWFCIVCFCCFCFWFFTEFFVAVLVFISMFVVVMVWDCDCCVFGLLQVFFYCVVLLKSFLRDGFFIVGSSLAWYVCLCSWGFIFGERWLFYFIFRIMRGVCVVGVL